MIKSFKCKETEKLYNRQRSKKLPRLIERVAFRKLLILNEAESLDDLRIPTANHLEKLSGNRNGQYSIRINDQWRLCFRWSKGDTYEVEIVDYH